MRVYVRDILSRNLSSPIASLKLIVVHIIGLAPGPSDPVDVRATPLCICPKPSMFLISDFGHQITTWNSSSHKGSCTINGDLSFFVYVLKSSVKLFSRFRLSKSFTGLFRWGRFASITILLKSGGGYMGVFIKCGLA